MATMQNGRLVGTLVQVDYKRNITLEEAERYIPNFKHCYQFFTMNAIYEALNSEQGRFGNFVSTEYVPVENSSSIRYHEANNLKIATNVSYPVREYTTIKGQQWERTVNKICDEFLVPSNYDLYSAKLYRIMLLHDFPYLSNYPFEVYSFQYNKEESHEIYVKMTNPVTNKSHKLYVPILALKNKSKKMIVDRFTSYMEQYYHGEERKHFLDEELEMLDYNMTIEFFNHVVND